MTPLLETKLYGPRRRAALVPRPRLIERLEQGAEGKVTLVSAPAGFGKTTLLAEWLRGAVQRTAAWVCLDRRDNNPVLFWSYVVAALRTVRPEVGETASSALNTSQPPPMELLLTGLINEISAGTDDLALVLDDYHTIDAESVHSAVSFLVDHLPPRLHLIIATRADPPLPLARLRGRGELCELRASDLRFTREEAATFLNQAMELGLTSDQVEALDKRAEGWIAGLQLAALSMQGRDDVSGFIRAFAGDDRYIVDYLVEEVLERQPQHVRNFLLKTSILDSMSGPLCDAVTCQTDARGLLESLERGNLFVFPLDEKRRWFRYHQLFADVLRAHASEQVTAEIPALHRRASEWYERNGFLSESIRHALAAEDFGRAADLVESVGRKMLTSRQDESFMSWLQALPDEVIRNRPVLCLYYALALVAVEPEAAKARLRDAELWLELIERAGPEATDAELVIVDEDGFRSLPGTAAIVHAYLAGARGDVSGTMHFARRARDLLPEDDHLWRGGAAGLLGLAYWTSGRLDDAHEAFSDATALLLRTGDATQEVSGALVLGDIRTAQGRLREAESLCQQALARLASQGGPMPPQAIDLHVALSELRFMQGDLPGAMACLQSGNGLNKHGGIAEHRHRWYTSMARIKEAHGGSEEALELLGEAERLYIRSPAPDVRPIAALKTRVFLRQGRLAESQRWARKLGLSTSDDLSYPREFEYITLARILLAHYRRYRAEDVRSEALALLGRLREAAEAGGRIGSVIEVLALEALFHEARGDTLRALAPLEQALTLAEPEGYVQIFVDEGEIMRNLLRHAAAKGVASSYASRLLAAFDGPAPHELTRGPDGAGLFEALTGREIQVLHLIAAGMRNQEIAEQLLISLATVKRHIANVYGKLGVRHRTEAVKRANELNLL